MLGQVKKHINMATENFLKNLQMYSPQEHLPGSSPKKPTKKEIVLRKESRNSYTIAHKSESSHLIPNVNYDEITLNKHLGMGTTASVFSATHHGEIAYKSFNHQPNSIKTFANEVYIMFACQHPNIVNFYGICIQYNKQGSLDKLGLLMELMALGSLQTILAKKTVKFTLLDKLRIALDIASALKYLHDENIIHRDVKPDNILISKKRTFMKNVRFFAKLTDFGAAIKQTNDNSEVTLGVGTPCYIAPEILSFNPKKYDPDNLPQMKPTDIYSFGLVCFALIYGKEPKNINNTAFFKPKNKYLAFFLNLAKWCCHEKPQTRPTANDVVETLRKIQTTPSYLTINSI